MLAATRDAEIFLEPQWVLRKNGREEATLLHEFLHVLVEGEASPGTPLWLREGIVEALAAGGSAQGGAEAGIDLGKLDAALAGPADQASSQRAHAEAGLLARALMARFGIEQVRAWLRSGRVPELAITTAQGLGAGGPSTQR